MNPASIFLSYAREDAPSARRIAEALRASGHEVWFDENELRGGDAWDAKIRRQIRECTLFLPLISDQTQARPEGYFRREWKLAVERTHDMAAGIAFLVPIVVDDIREDDALVPEEFLRVQWTRLPGALPSPAFIEQIQRLITAPRTRRSAPAGAGSAAAAASSSSSAAAPSASASAHGAGGTRAANPTGTPSRSKSPTLLLAGLGAVAVAAALFVMLRPSPPPPTAAVAGSTATPTAVPNTVPTAVPTAAPNRSTVADKSIAVLPFANMSEDKDNAFFTDGVHEDILTNLALVRDLKVISRTTVVRFRDSKKSVREIGEELGVAYILEGSVRRVGNRVRVTGQLINTRTDEHVWAKSYDRDLTDIFAIQAALAQEIAGALQAALSPETRQQLARRPTDNPAAYDLYLRGRDTRNRSPTGSREALDEAERLFQAAVDLDPKFAAAWGELAVVHALRVFWEQDTSPGRFERAEAAAAQARRLAPDAPEVIRLDGTFAYYAYRDYDRATAAFQRIIDQQPNDATGYASLALILRRQGRWAEALAAHQRAAELDPANISQLRNQLSTLIYVRRWPEARAVQQRLLVLLPGDLRAQSAAAELEDNIAGGHSHYERFVASLPADVRDSRSGLLARRQLALRKGDYAAFIAIDDAHPNLNEDQAPEQQMQVAAFMHLRAGETARAHAVARKLLAAADETLAGVRVSALRPRLDRAAALTILGRTDEALQTLAEFEKLLPESRDALDSNLAVLVRSDTLAIAGRREEAVAELRRFLAKPSQWNVSDVRRRSSWALGGYAPFEELLADPKNNAPLY
jgi:TolB-like protein/Flp pilus assembly protein TadD